MVTQDAAVVPRVNKVKMKKMKKKKSKKKKIKGTENLDSENEADKLDMDEKVYPLSHYISDQEELVNQMFLTIHGSKLEAMLPPVLKSIPLKELKRLCLHELRGMSKRRILCCINGQVMEGSSGSEDEEEEKEEAVNETQKHNEANSKGDKRKPGDEQPHDSYLHKKIKVEPGLEDGSGSGEGKSVLELLELEMRARIIKTMLEKGDEGKKITEDAIVAVMQSAKKITGEGVDVTGGSKEVAASKGDSQEKKSDREAEAEDEDVEERSRGRRRGQGRRGDRRRRHDPAHDDKKGSSTRSQKRGDGSYSDDGSHGRGSKKQKESNISKKHVTKKKKITRKEFEERMKRAKKNRTYRQRKSSEDEEKTNENEDTTKSTKEDKDEKTEDITDKKEDAPLEGNNIQDKPEGEVSEKEEGEIDSNEEEEGACSPSEISSGSRCSSSGSSSRSWSRSYSRSLSRSPYRGRQRRSRRRSRSRRRRRSYSRSYSRSRTPDRRRSRGNYQQRRKSRRDSPKGNDKRDVKKTSPEDISPSREEDWGHKCDIEFVDSEEDFDDNPEATKKDSGAHKTLPVNRIDRASISFSLQKKPVGIAQNVDLDDLPLKKKQMSSMTDDIETLDTVKPTTRNEEIVISSDSEAEVQTSTQKSPTKSKSNGKKLSELQPPVTTANASNLGGVKRTDHPSSKENISLQSDHEKKSVKKTSDSETKSEETTKGVMEESTDSSVNLITGLNQETSTEQKSSDETKITQNVSNRNTETGMEKQAVKDIEKVDPVVSVNVGESPTKDLEDSENMDDSESANIDCDDTPEKLNRYIGEHGVVTYKKEQVEKNTKKLSTDSAERVNDKSVTNCKGKDDDSSDNEKTQDIDTAEAHASRVIAVERVDDDSRIRESRTAKSELYMDSEQSSDKETKQNIEKGVSVKDKYNIQSLEEEEEDQRDPEAAVYNQTAKSKHCNEKEMEIKVRDASVFFETEEQVEKTEILTTSEQKHVEPDSKDTDSILESQSEEDFYKEAEQVKLSGDEQDNDNNDGKGFFKDKTPVEPIRIERKFTGRYLKSSPKIEVVMPERSWLKRDRKNKEKTKDVLEMERTDAFKSTQFEGVCGPSQESELETETSQSIKVPELAENEERQIQSPGSISNTENSQPGEEPGGQKQVCPSPKQDLQEISHAEDKTLRKIDHDTEIIGVIETSKDTSDNFDDMELGGSSWSMRWLQSEKVQKVVTSSKMLSRVRKKIQRKEKATKVVMAEKVEEAQKPVEPVIPVIGSIEEYERLFGTKVKKDEAPIAPAGSESQDNVGEGQALGGISQTQDAVPETKIKGNPVFGSDDDGEDSEEEALWSKIIKK